MSRVAQKTVSPKECLASNVNKQLAELFAFLAATTDDPKRIVAACVEESEKGRCLIVISSVNNGNLDNVKVGFQRMAMALERIARAG